MRICGRCGGWMVAVWLGPTVLAYRCACGFRYTTSPLEELRAKYPKPDEVLEPFMQVV